MKRREAIKWLIKPTVTSTEISPTKIKELEAYNMAVEALSEPTVIRSRTLMPTKDFKEWAKRVRETNPNAIIIPCDAEEAALNKMLEEEMIVLPQDYVKVVRCKDCQFYTGDRQYCENDHFCRPDDFCSKGIPRKERKK